MSAQEPNPDVQVSPARTVQPRFDRWAVAWLFAAALVWTVCGLGFARLAAHHVAPPTVSAYLVEHVAAFYLVALTAGMGLKRVSVGAQGFGLVVVALLLWGMRLLLPIPGAAGFSEFVCDVMGATAAMAPLMLGRRQGQMTR
jgi:cytochrome b